MKSDLQKVYEYVNTQPLGSEFNIRLIMKKLDIPQNTASAALCYLTTKGMFERKKEKDYSPGTGYPLVVYRFIKKIDKAKHSKPIEHKRVVIKRKVKPVAEEKPKRKYEKKKPVIDINDLYEITNALFNCCVQLEIFASRLKEVTNGKVSKSVRPAP